VEAGGNFFEFQIGVANPEDSKAILQELPFGNNKNFLPITEECEADGAVGNGAVAEEFHRKRGTGRGWRRRFKFWAGRLRFLRLLRRWRRRRKFPTENIAAPALVFRFAGPFDTVCMQLRVVDGKQLVIMDCRFGVGGHHGPVMVEIKKPDGPRYQQENNEDGELFLLFHAAVLK
jgi:hypothetical protein